MVFVDDEPQLLRGLQRSLGGMKPGWELSFVTSPHEALALMSERDFDVVVTDMLMPGMNGVEFLKLVQQRHPGAIRMILSGHADRELLLRATHCAHQFLTKPCPSVEIKSTLQRALRTRDELDSEALREVTSRLSSLPTLPSVYVEIQAELRSPNSSIQSVGRIIERDPAMAAKTLQVVNSAFFGVPRPVDSVAEAAGFLGLDLVTSLVLSLEVLSGLERKNHDLAECARVRRHCTRTGHVARRVATSLGLDASQSSTAFLAGMLHDIGELVLLADMPDERALAHEMARREGLPRHVAETRVLGASHARIGGYLMGIWGLPQPLVEAIAFHHEPTEATRPGVSPLLAVHVAAALCAESTAPGGAWSNEGLDTSLLRSENLEGRVEEWRAFAADPAHEGGSS